MGKRVAALMVMAIVLGAVPATAKQARVVEERYNYLDAGATGAHGSFGGARFDTYDEERFVSVEIIDAAGQKVSFDVRQGRGNGIDIDGCGSTDQPVPIKGGKEVRVSFVGELGSENECEPNIPSQGIIRATFTR